ncbi:MAG: ABC transporter permease subunit [Roseburia sp.]|nr:ABC transporter permease subunit [Roseburia sp.]MCM1098979.1 ABC transporter permease subunit [Ruminococcus flavefaciens]
MNEIRMEKKNLGKMTWRRDIQRNWRLYLLALPIVAFFFIFNYIPMGGLIMAFEDFKPAKGILGSTWVGLANFREFFASPNFFTVLRNTFVISALGLFVGFPLSIGFALLLNEVHVKWFKKGVQTISYMPYFISTVVVCGLIIDFCASKGLITNLLVNLGLIERQNLLTNPNYFWAINLISDQWQGLGYGSIVFVAAITNVSGELHEAAAIDGANRLQRVWHITLPGIKPMVVSMLILKCGTLMTVGMDKILNLYNPSIYSTADVITTYVQRIGLEGGRFGYSTAVGLFNSVINTTLLLVANHLSAKLADQSLF